jgi:hypothetical protein
MEEGGVYAMLGTLMDSNKLPYGKTIGAAGILARSLGIEVNEIPADLAAVTLPEAPSE